jgi:Rieske Fe-S protein
MIQGPAASPTTLEVVPGIHNCELSQAKGSTMKRISRKAFIVGGVAAAAAGACLCSKTGRATIFGSGDTPHIASDAYDIGEDQRIRIRLDRVPELAFDGGSIKIVDSNIDDALIVVRIAKDDYVASSIRCTHRGVEVEYQPDDKCFKCASLGGSTFKTSGEKVRGFAKSALKTYAISSEGSTLIVQLT